MIKAFCPPKQWGYSLIEIAGNDTIDFLQRITTLDLNQVEDGFAHRGYILTPQGKVAAAFDFFKLSNRFFFELEGGQHELWKKRLFDVVEYYHFSESIELSNLTEDYQPLFLLGGPPQDLHVDDSFFTSRKDRSGNEFYSTLWLPATAEIKTFTQTKSIQLIDEMEWEAFRISKLNPRLGYEINENTNPLELGDGAEVFSPKGCYPGQEVIEKIISIGSPPRRLCLLQVENSNDDFFDGSKPIQYDVITKSGEKAGEMTSFSHAKKLGLAVIKKSFCNSNQQFSIQNRLAQIVAIRGQQ